MALGKGILYRYHPLNLPGKISLLTPDPYLRWEVCESALYVPKWSVFFVFFCWNPRILTRISINTSVWGISHLRYGSGHVRKPYPEKYSNCYLTKIHQPSAILTKIGYFGDPNIRPPPTNKYPPPPTNNFDGGHISDFSECGWYVGVGLWKVVNLEPIHAIGPYSLPPTGVKLAFCQLYLAARARLVELAHKLHAAWYRVTGPGVCDYRCGTGNPLKINSINDRNSYMPIYIAKKLRYTVIPLKWTSDRACYYSWTREMGYLRFSCYAFRDAFLCSNCRCKIPPDSKSHM